MRRLAIAADGGGPVRCSVCRGAAQADDTVVVPGTAFPGSGTYLTYFGCVDLFHADTARPAVAGHARRRRAAGAAPRDLTLPGAGPRPAR